MGGGRRVGVSVAACVAVGVCVGVGVGVVVGVGVNLGVAVEVGAGVGVTVDVGVAVGVLVGSAVVAVGVGVANAATGRESAPKNALLHVQRLSATMAVITGNNIFQRSMRRLLCQAIEGATGGRAGNEVPPF